MTDFQVAYTEQSLETCASTAAWDALCGLMAMVQDGAERLEIRKQIEALEAEMVKLPQVEQPVEHFYADKLYGRLIFNPAGSFIVTKIHKQENISTILKGRLAVLSENGLEVLEAPRMFVTKPGTKRVLYAQTDVLFSTVHQNPDDLRSPDELEERIIAKSFDEIEYIEREVIS